MDTDELIVRGRMESALSGLQPDVVALVEGSVTRGRQLKRRRRTVVATFASASVVFAVLAGVLVGTGVLEGGATRPADGPHDSARRVPATAPSLVAAVVSTLPKGTQVTGIRVPSKHRRSTLTATIDVVGANGYLGRISVQVQTPFPRDVGVGCAQPGNLLFCGTVKLPDGRHAATSAYTTSFPAAGVKLNVSAIHRGVFLTETVAGASNVREMPLSDRQLAAIAFDPRVGLRTTSKMVQRGANMFRQWSQTPFTAGVPPTGR